MELADHFRAIFRHRLSVLAASLAVAAAVFAWSYSQPPVYSAKALITVTSGRAMSGQSVTEQDTLFITRNYAELARTRPVLADAALRSELRLSVGDAQRRLSARAADDVGFLTVSATGPSPRAATRLAQGGADALIASVAGQQAEAVRETVSPINEEIARLGGELAQLPPGSSNREALVARYQAVVQAATERRLAPIDRLVLVSPARENQDPVSPTPVRNAVLAFLVALVVNSELAVLIEALRDRLTARDDEGSAGEILGLPVLARVPPGDGEETQEAFRTLRTSLMFLETSGPLRTVAVVSANPNAGKTFTCVHLARSVADLELAAVLVDGDLRRPSVHRDCGVSVSPGLSDVLRGATVSGAVRADPENGYLRLLPGGAPVDDAAGLVAARKFREVLASLDGSLVVVDTPACDVFADGFAIASHCDAALVVVDMKGTRRRAVRRLVEQMNRVGANPIGVVVNRAESRGRSSYYYYGRRARVSSR